MNGPAGQPDQPPIEAYADDPEAHGFATHPDEAGGGSPPVLPGRPAPMAIAAPGDFNRPREIAGGEPEAVAPQPDWYGPDGRPRQGINPKRMTNSYLAEALLATMQGLMLYRHIPREPRDRMIMRWIATQLGQNPEARIELNDLSQEVLETLLAAGRALEPRPLERPHWTPRRTRRSDAGSQSGGATEASAPQQRAHVRLGEAVRLAALDQTAKEARSR